MEPWKQVLSQHLPHFIIPTYSKARDYVLVYDAIELFFEYFCPDQFYKSNPRNSCRFRTTIHDLSIPAYLVSPFINWFKAAEKQGFDDLEDLDSTEIFNAISDYQSNELVVKQPSRKSFIGQPIVKKDVKNAFPTVSQIKETTQTMLTTVSQNNQDRDDISSSSSVELTEEEDSLEETDHSKVSPSFKGSNLFLNNPLSRAIERSKYPYNEDSASCKEILSKLENDVSSKSKSSLKLKSKHSRKKKYPALFGISQATSSSHKRKEPIEFNLSKESKQAKKTYSRFSE